jgi:hypothetical protein
MIPGELNGATSANAILEVLHSLRPFIIKAHLRSRLSVFVMLLFL